MQAAKQAGVAFGPRLANGASTPRSSSATRRKPKAAKLQEDHGGAGENKTPTNSQKDSGVLGQLLDKFPDFDPDWPDPIKEKWFAGFDQFMKGAAKAK